MDTIRADMSQFYPLKVVYENLLGGRTYLRLKETGTLKGWKQETAKLLKAVELSVAATVQVADEDWFEEIEGILSRGRELVADAESITDLFAHLSATLTKLVFTQIGFMPSSRSSDTTRLVRKEWKLNHVRNVQYVQNVEQKQYQLLLRQRRANPDRG